MVTFGFTVGGSEQYYANLSTTIRAIKERVKCAYRILVLDNDNKFSSNDSLIKIIQTNYPRKLQYYWSNRYNLYKYAETEHVVYADIDTVIVNDNIEQLIHDSENKFYICQHWWVDTYSKYIEYNSVNNIPKQLILKNNSPYFASGVFIFNINTCAQIFEKYWQIFNICYSKDDNFKQGITDEFMLCHTLNSAQNYKFCHGSLNHCCEKQLMPIMFDGNTIFGKNPYEKEFKPIIFAHCDTFRRDPSIGYDMEMSKYIKKAFYL